MLPRAISGLLPVILVLSVLALAAACSSGGSSAKQSPTAARPNTPVPTATPLPPEGFRLLISVISLNAAILEDAIQPDGRFPPLPNPDDAVIYDFAALSGYGGKLGEGHAIIIGKLDSGTAPCRQGTVPAPCRGVFWDLSRLTSGTEVRVYRHGELFRYRVTGNRLVANTDPAYDDVYRASDKDMLSLITAGGNLLNDRYDSTRVVTAERIRD